jgi:hypothetical protein
VGMDSRILARVSEQLARDFKTGRG